MSGVDLAGVELLDGLSAAAVDDISAQMRPRDFAAGDLICRQGDPGESLFVIRRGLAQVWIDIGGRVEMLGVMRRGDVAGEMSLLTGEPRSATVQATTDTQVAELDQTSFAAVLAEHPEMLRNLTAVLSRRLARANVASVAARGRGEAIGILVDPELRGLGLVDAVIDQTARATPRGAVAVEWSDRAADQRLSRTAPGFDQLPDVLAALDDLLAEHGTVLVVAGADDPQSGQLLEQTDRVVVLASAAGAPRVLDRLPATRRPPELVVVGDGGHDVTGPPGVAPVRVVARTPALADIAWLGRHLSRTKLGLTLGAGGAKGYAHVGALDVLNKAGYTVDYVSGSSMGAVVGVCIAAGMSAGDIEHTLRKAFTPETVKDMLTLSFSGTSVGLETMRRLCRDLVGEVSFDELALPLVVMTVDLNTRLPAPITSGPVWEALLAATALAGLFPPYLRDDQRLVDALALVPVPLDGVIDAGADITVAVNVMSRDVLDAWPGQPAPDPQPPGRYRMLETLMEVMDLSQLDASVRHAARADVVITPRFGPSTWRDFHLADAFLEAGRQAATEQLPALQSLARPESDKGAPHG